MKRYHSQRGDGFRYRGEYVQYDEWTGNFYGASSGNNYGGAGAYSSGGGYYYNGIPISQGHYQGITSGTWYPVGYRTEMLMPDGSTWNGPNTIKYWAVNYSAVPIATNLSNNGAPGYNAQTFSERGYQGSWTSAEGVGAAGGFWYILNGKVKQNRKGQWYLYASASAWAPAAEANSDAIKYFANVSVLENGVPIDTYSGNLQIWDTNLTRIGQKGYTYIGYGYMPLPGDGQNISIKITISYNTYNWWNGNASPQTPYIFKIDF
jgi:hypothetical protein